MSQPVDLYGTAYGHFATPVLEAVRRETYGEDFGQSSWTTGPELRGFGLQLGLGAADRVLDVGCGSGGPALWLARTFGCAVTGVDQNAAGLATGRGLAQAAGVADRVQFHEADLRHPLPFAEGAFDAILSLDAICHLADRSLVFDEWFRVLRPGGRAAFTDPVVVTGLVAKEDLATRSSTGEFAFAAPGVNERLLVEAGLTIVGVEDLTAQEAEVSGRWHDARERRAAELIPLEGAETYEGLQRFLAAVHRLSRERRLSRFLYVASRPGG